MMDDLEITFTKAAVANAKEVERHGLPRRARWLGMIAKYGSAKRAWEAQTAGYSDGFTDLCIAGLQRLTVEYLMLHPRFSALFSVDQRREAYHLLIQYCGSRFTDHVDPATFVMSDSSSAPSSSRLR